MKHHLRFSFVLVLLLAIGSACWLDGYFTSQKERPKFEPGDVINHKIAPWRAVILRINDKGNADYRIFKEDGNGGWTNFQPMDLCLDMPLCEWE